MSTTMINLVPIAFLYFIYSFSVTTAKNRNRRNILKMLIDNNLVSNSADAKLNFLTEVEKSTTRNTLAIALGLMGLALGLLLGSYMIVHLSMNDVLKEKSIWYDIKNAIELGAPLFFASIGVTIAYFIEKKGRK